MPSQTPPSRAPLSTSRTVPPPQRGTTPPQRSAPPPLRRSGRRSAPPAIAVAQPIITAANPAPDVAAYAPAKPPIGAAKVTSAKAAANATLLRKWLTPQTLRQQFILTEILQPPIALRAAEASK